MLFLVFQAVFIHGVKVQEREEREAAVIRGEGEAAVIREDILREDVIREDVIREDVYLL